MYATSDYQAEHFQADGLESTVSQIKQEVLSIIVLIFVAHNFVPYDLVSFYQEIIALTDNLNDNVLASEIIAQFFFHRLSDENIPNKTVSLW